MEAPLRAASFALPDLAATWRMGERMGEIVQAGDIILLAGGLGAGKTSLAQGIARGLGIHDRVTSPTFALLHEYREGRLPLYHFDLYRLEASDVLALGFPEYWEAFEGVTLIEWPERLDALELPSHLEVSLEPREADRQAHLRPVGPGGEALLARFEAHERP